MTSPAGLPVPQGDYVTARRHGALIFTSGMTPRQNGRLMFEGPIDQDTPLVTWRNAVILACNNALIAAASQLEQDEKIGSILSMTVYVAALAEFTSHSKIADFASEHLKAELGEAGACARCAVGVATLPGNAPVEISLIVAV